MYITSSTLKSFASRYLMKATAQTFVKDFQIFFNFLFFHWVFLNSKIEPKILRKMKLFQAQDRSTMNPFTYHEKVMQDFQSSPVDSKGFFKFWENILSLFLDKFQNMHRNSDTCLVIITVWKNVCQTPLLNSWKPHQASAYLQTVCCCQTLKTPQQFNEVFVQYLVLYLVWKE